MLGTRTKQVFAYGKRGRRIVNVSERRSSEWEELSTARSKSPVVKPMRFTKDHDAPARTPPRAKRVYKKPKRHSPASLSPSPAVAAKVIRKRQVTNKCKTSPAAKSAPKAAHPSRAPLASVPSNLLDSPAFSTKREGSAVFKGVPNIRKPNSPPMVTVDIIVMDGSKKVSQERRLSRRDVEANPVQTTRASVKPAPRLVPVIKHGASVIVISDSEPAISPVQPPIRPAVAVKTNKFPIVLTDTEDEELSQPKRGARRRVKTQVISSDSEDSLSDAKDPYQPPVRPHGPKLIFDKPPYQAPKGAQSTFITPVPYASRIRKVTPIRYQTAALFPHAASPPSPTTPSDFDLSLELSELDTAVTPTVAKLIPLPPGYLCPLLAECRQTTPHEFSAFIETFPFDSVVRPLDTPTGPLVAKYEFRKIGEASYSEVFGIGDVVLKIIPLRDEEPSSRRVVLSDAETPPPSDAKDVLKEIIVTRAMGDMCDGFVKLLRTYVVRGRYPSLLLDLWDEYNDEKGSESVRPDNFLVSQIYAIIVLPNGGPDLESYIFSQPTKTGWRQACSLFWQVTRALAEAEDLVSFEHRDLHWGQILIKNTFTGPMRRLPRSKIMMDNPVHGVAVTIIDLGLSRMDSSDGQGTQTHWTPFEEEVFEGKGDYQFDIYRMMREHIGKSWTAFHPLTNVMWLHYLALKLLHSKRLKPPSASRKAPATSDNTFTERECYECLAEVEKILANVVSPFLKPISSQKRRRKAQMTTKQTSEGPRNARDILGYARTRSWVS
ncbi:hypothetical protein NEOLEDRAFT_1084994 [Neolentinus lepideus HHB14362 ss-1]|uniref:non-specific serine/threonine protein kinase n=1 Tax=Neolentinus lepideus HHB14362 ss-1 TaxID=1314782 RepID=A0A165V719_9AGAM|nr:hypothetical protein NEOLEDRAFT_1084994 [Neolentinus lepideus HHB14362 ss-1]